MVLTGGLLPVTFTFYLLPVTFTFTLRVQDMSVDRFPITYLLHLPLVLSSIALVSYPDGPGLKSWRGDGLSLLLVVIDSPSRRTLVQCVTLRTDVGAARQIADRRRYSASNCGQTLVQYVKSRQGRFVHTIFWHPQTE